MYAIIEDSGTQIKVEEGQVFDIDLRDYDEKKKSLTFDRVLMLGDANTPDTGSIGTPYVSGASVAAEVLEERKGVKIDVIKFKRRKGYKRKQGHRQKYLRVRITGINP